MSVKARASRFLEPHAAALNKVKKFGPSLEQEYNAEVTYD